MPILGRFNAVEARTHLGPDLQHDLSGAVQAIDRLINELRELFRGNGWIHFIQPIGNPFDSIKYALMAYGFNDCRISRLAGSAQLKLDTLRGD